MTTPSIFFVLTWLFLSLPAIASDLTYQRQDFRAAREAFTRGDRATFERLLPGLMNYPLYGYLVYQTLQDRIAPDSEIQAFLTRYDDLPVATTVRNAWLKRLAKEGRWSKFLANYRDTNEKALHCLAITARSAMRDPSHEEKVSDQEWLKEVKSLWLVGKRQPFECETTFSLWREAGGMTAEDLWQRITMAFDTGNVDLAQDLSERLPAAMDRLWVQVWAKVHRDPLSGFKDSLLANDSPRARVVIGHGITRLARKDIATAMNRWNEVKNRYSFNDNERWTIERSIALRAAGNRNPNALQLLEHLSFTDAEVRRARVRAALWVEDWTAVLRYVRALKPWEREADRWRYWEARALEKTGRPEEAKEIYHELARHRGYHGFLAADRVGRPYAFNHRPLNIAADEMERLKTQPAMVRAHEWFLLGELPNGRREWTAAIRNADPTELTALAQLAAQWDLPDRIIATLGRTVEEDDLVLRFPLAYQHQIMHQAAKAGIAPAVVFAVARQESIFIPDIRSSAGAVGLMQLMPATAAQVAKRLKVPFKNRIALIDPDYNLRLGCDFLAKMLNRHESLALAAAAYNAGPSRVKQWRPQTRMAADIWVESIPFDETRRYVRNVLTYATIYTWRLNQPVRRLADEMPKINP